MKCAQISLMKSYYLHNSNYCHHIDCYTHNYSTAIPSGLHQVIFAVVYMYIGCIYACICLHKLETDSISTSILRYAQ